MQNKGISIIAG